MLSVLQKPKINQLTFKYICKKKKNQSFPSERKNEINLAFFRYVYMYVYVWVYVYKHEERPGSSANCSSMAFSYAWNKVLYAWNKGTPMVYEAGSSGVLFCNYYLS